jgi:tripartite motif-containing protein 37
MKIGTFISVFLELVSGSIEPAKYDYKVELLKPSVVADASSSPSPICRVFTSVFEEGECWGYNRFCKIETILQGFLDEHGGITFEFSIRPSTYYQLCRDQQRYIKKLEELVDSTEQQQERKRRRKEGDSYSSDPDSTPQVVE